MEGGVAKAAEGCVLQTSGEIIRVTAKFSTRWADLSEVSTQQGPVCRILTLVQTRLRPYPAHLDTPLRLCWQRGEME